MGHNVWMKILRFIMCLIAVMAVMVYFAPKAC